jgi:hypothetical protein
MTRKRTEREYSPAYIVLEAIRTGAGLSVREFVRLLGLKRVNSYHDYARKAPGLQTRILAALISRGPDMVEEIRGILAEMNPDAPE